MPGTAVRRRYHREFGAETTSAIPPGGPAGICGNKVGAETARAPENLPNPPFFTAARWCTVLVSVLLATVDPVRIGSSAVLFIACKGCGPRL